MDPLAAHRSRVAGIRQAFAEANERFVTRLRRAEDEAVRRVPEGKGWSAAQIGWHVAKVTTRFAGLMSGDLDGATALGAGFVERPWSEIVSTMPGRLLAPASFHPPESVTRAEAIAALEASGVRLAHALDVLTPERAAGMGINSAIVGTINLYQMGEWATAHVIRHNKQAKGVLGE
jgi:hypothetical protein